ncbi:MAG: peptidase M4 [Ilumatobacteraceae bacterium]
MALSPSANTRSQHPWLNIPQPTTRSLQVYTVDPSAGSYIGNHTTATVPWESLEPGPIGRKVAVIDYDGSNGWYYPPVDLDNPLVLSQNGLEPSESDPRFHQQMVYAVASQTIEMFESALGRTLHWRRAERSSSEQASEPNAGDIGVLHLYPHAMRQANAYYSPQARGILFGYFTANKTGQGNNLPGQRVFTCLSHDIIAHEVTHAIVDGIRSYFTEPTNPDVLAFHEGFADLAALFSHFSEKDALIDAIQHTGGRLYEDELAADAPPTQNSGQSSGDPVIVGQIRQVNPLVQLALQFGEARGGDHGLRTALGTKPNSDDINTRIDDPHFRGSILVAAVFDAYFTVYTSRTANLFRIFRAGDGVTSTPELPGPMAEELARCAAETATFFFRLCARSLDYCPPVDITFGDFLRALITTVIEEDPDDHMDICDALMQAFRVRGIYSKSATFFSKDALMWPSVTLPGVGPQRIKNPRTNRLETMDLVFGGPHGLTSEERDVDGRVLLAYADLHRQELGLDPDLPIEVPSFHQTQRMPEDGRLRVDLVVEVIQSRRVPFDQAVPDAGTFPLRGGLTLIIAAPELSTDVHGKLVCGLPMARFAIGASLVGDEGERREQTQRSFGLSLGMDSGDTTNDAHFQANFGLVHMVDYL